MEIVFRTPSLKRSCTDSKQMRREWGDRQAKVLRQRLDELHAAETLEVMRHLPGRCHELKGDRKGQLSLDLVHPDRLIFRPASNPRPEKPDGGLDWARVTAIEVVEVADTHE